MSSSDLDPSSDTERYIFFLSSLVTRHSSPLRLSPVFSARPSLSSGPCLSHMVPFPWSMYLVSGFSFIVPLLSSLVPYVASLVSHLLSLVFSFFSIPVTRLS